MIINTLKDTVFFALHDLIKSHALELANIIDKDEVQLCMNDQLDRLSDIVRTIDQVKQVYIHNQSLRKDSPSLPLPEAPKGLRSDPIKIPLNIRMYWPKTNPSTSILDSAKSILAKLAKIVKR